MTTGHRNIKFASTIALLVFTTLVLWSYSPIKNAAPNFDDGPNLDGLTLISSVDQAIHFAMSGHAGPLGRPIALATFLPNAQSWPDSPEDFLRENILIHVLNMLLVAALTLQLTRAIAPDDRKAEFLAAITALLWAALPILASASYMIIQRMTTLSATWALCGLNGFLYGHKVAYRHPVRGLFISLVPLAFFTILSILSKENGALTPVFALTLTILTGWPPNKAYRRLVKIVLLVPLTFICGYLLYKATSLPFSSRNFNLAERLATESVILWEYLWRSFIPNGALLGPFHDAQTAIKPWYSPAALLASFAWVTIITMAIKFRRSLPVFSFAVLWYLAGHLIESTTLPLELYFEHRNYMPLIGPCIGAVLFLSKSTILDRRPLLLFSALYISLELFVLNNVTRLAGNPEIAATIWNERSPNSIRAAQYASIEKLRIGQAKEAVTIIDRAYGNNPLEISLWLQRIQFRCLAGEDSESTELIDKSSPVLSNGNFNDSVINIIFKMSDLSDQKQCTSLNKESILELTGQLLENPHITRPTITALIHRIRARQYNTDQEADKKLSELWTSWEIQPQRATVADLVIAMRSNNQDCQAKMFLEQLMNQQTAPWESFLQEFIDLIPSDSCQTRFLPELDS